AVLAVAALLGVRRGRTVAGRTLCAVLRLTAGITIGADAVRLLLGAAFRRLLPVGRSPGSGVTVCAVCGVVGSIRAIRLRVRVGILGRRFRVRRRGNDDR